MIRSRPRFALMAVAVAAIVSLGSPAGAAPAGTVEANVFLRNLTLAAGGPTVGEDLAVFLSSDRDGWASEVTFTVDVAAVTAVADVTVEPEGPDVTCSASGSVTRCAAPGPHRVIDVPDNGSFGVIAIPSVLISLTARAGAATGDTGALTVTASADGGPVTTRTSRVRIGEGVNLTAVDARPRSVAPGVSVELRPEVRNSGSRDVGSVALVLTDGSALEGTNFGNCVYGDSTVCTFDTTLTAGRTYRISEPFTARAPRDAVAGSEAGTDVQWLTGAEWEDLRDEGNWPADARQGTGPGLRLTEVASRAGAQAPQADIDGDDNGASLTFTVSGARRADIAAIGATITGPPGAERTIGVGLVNRGTGTLRYPPFLNNLPGVHVVLPPGLAVVRADERCVDLSAEDPAGPPPPSAAATGAVPPLYLCTPETFKLAPGRRLTFAFTVKVTSAARDGGGFVDVSMYGEPTVDRTPGNNRARIGVAAGGGGGGLPVTGTTAATVAGCGMLLVVAGAAIMTSLRRRR